MRETGTALGLGRWRGYRVLIVDLDRLGEHLLLFNHKPRDRTVLLGRSNSAA
jgi:cellulose biosynthesis protein BcsQ